MDLLLRHGAVKLPCEIHYPRGHLLFANDIVHCYHAEQKRQKNPPNDWSKIIRQVFTYMVNLCTRYGVISTYLGTWFLRRKHGSELEVEISTRFVHDARDPSVARCLWYLLNRSDHFVLPCGMPSFNLSTEPATTSGKRSDPTAVPSGRARERDVDETLRPRTRSKVSEDTVENLQENLAVECRESKEMFARGRWMGQPCTVVFVPSLDDLDSVVSAMDTLDNA